MNNSLKDISFFFEDDDDVHDDADVNVNAYADADADASSVSLSNVFEDENDQWFGEESISNNLGSSKMLRPKDKDDVDKGNLVLCYLFSDDEDSSNSDDVTKDLSLEEMNASCDEYTRPISFAGGMDYNDCLAYYELRESQHKGGVVRRSRVCANRRSSLQKDSGKLRSILRRKTSSVVPPCRTEAKGRRISLTGLPAMILDDIQDSSTTTSSLSSSDDDTTKIEPRRVGFCQHVKIITHPTKTDYSSDTKAKLWLSPQEIVSCMQRAGTSVALPQSPRPQLSIHRDGARAA
jgi:hypothetical protein